MKTIIAGSRTFTDLNVIFDAVSLSKFTITEVVSGVASGVDSLGEEWAALNGIPVKRFPANWKKYGKVAGPIRNGEMGLYADVLIAIWDGESRGTRDMIAKAQLMGLSVYVHRITE